MKKIFTFIVSAMVAGSALALPQMKETNLKASRMPIATESALADFNLQPVKGAITAPQRTMVDGQQNAWDNSFVLKGEAVDFFGLGYDGENGEDVKATFDDFPMYVVQNLISTRDGKQQFVNYIMWPCRAMAEEGAFDAEGDIDWNKATQIFGSKEAAQMPMSIDEMITYTKDLWGRTDALIPVVEGFYAYVPTTVNYYWYSRGQGGYTWKGVDYAAKSSVLSQTGLTSNSYILLKDYDPDYKEMSMEGYYLLGTANANGEVVGSTITANFVLSGTPSIVGFATIQTEDFELHVFDCGLVDKDSMWGINYDLSFEPVQRYFVMWCDPTMMFFGQTQDGQMRYAWDQYTIANLSQKRPYPVTPLFYNTEDYHLTCFNATMYAKAGADLEGMWYMPEPEYTVNANGGLDKWLSVPTPGALIPAYNVGVAEQDGFYGLVDAVYVNPIPDNTAIGAADATYGFNYKYTIPSWGENSVLGATTLPCYFHYDSSDFNKMETRPTVGSAKANAIDYDPSSVETVVSDSPVVGTQYFNLQGQRLNVAPQQGIFIQREIKADGTVKATKIAK
ncbi:MAG: hypothetical protein K2M14_05660 [Muribaculaceae bacterium]|nr:hypothetical protein [Muribaculaceae bacterium]